MKPAVVLILSLVLLAEYGSANTIRNDDELMRMSTSAAKPTPVEAVDVANNLATPSMVALQAPGAGYPTRQCAGVGQACASHGDCCTSSCFGVLRTCIPNLGIALNIQIGRADEAEA